MGILDSFRKSKQESDQKGQKEHLTTPPPVGHTLKEIMQNKRMFDLFGKLLEKEGDSKLAQRVAERNLEEGDIALLEERRLVFSEKIVKSEKIEKLLTGESMIELARNNPDFQKVVNTLTPEGVANVIKSKLKEISITDENRFNDIVSKIEAKKSYVDGNYKEINDKLEKFLEEKKITPEEYLEVVAIKDPKEKREALKQLSYRTYGMFKRTLSNLPKGSIFGDWARKFDPLKDLKKTEVSVESSVSLPPAVAKASVAITPGPPE